MDKTEETTTLKIYKDAHKRLTVLLGELTAQSGKMLTYADALRIILQSSVTLPKELLSKVDEIIKERKDLGYTTREDFVRDAVRRRLEQLAGEFEYIIVPREDYEKLEEAINEMNAPFRNAADFVRKQIEEIIEKYEELKKTEQKRRRK
ncbi:ribbon-helix-helix protein, CopG family [Candidatus Bathyarchaeota archaeon]|nr:ribbon-helix-helix protein, CopG family [Candidatus Bathyarchaeota archaeon]